MRDRILASLHKDILGPWFPACVDESGGFHQRFAFDWSREDDESRFLVFQARMTWVCATMAAEGHGEYAEFARHGLRFLLDEMRDRETGAFRWSVRSQGSHDDERHAYGQAFAVYALAAAADALKSEEALAAAMGAFDWLERAHYDAEHGGWFEAATPSGEKILDKPGRCGIGTPYGQKSQNTHLHLLEAFTELFDVNGDDRVGARLEEVHEIFLRRFYVPEGWLHGFTEADWTPVPGTISHGHDVEAAHLLLSAYSSLQDRRTSFSFETETVARNLVDYALRTGWDEAGGGFFYAGSPEGEVLDRTKNWWVQAEGLLALATIWDRTKDDRYLEAARRQWGWIESRQIDRVYGGWHEALSPSGEPLGLDIKGHSWKEAYHDGRGLLYAARILL